MNSRTYMQMKDLEPDAIKLSMTDRHGKPAISMCIGTNCADVAFVTPACVTQWPRCTGDGNFGTMWGPSDISKAKFSLDLCDGPINHDLNTGFITMSDKLEKIDEKLLEFVFQNQLKILGRKNLSKEECKMLQIRTVRAKYDKNTGALTGHNIQLNTPKFAWDGMGGKYERKINICDHTGTVIPNGNVAPGDVVAATMYASQVYTGVGGDKFGIQWCFDDVSVICQRSKLEMKSQVTVFNVQQYNFATTYDDQAITFSDPINVV
jgi:hypothetical protein